MRQANGFEDAPPEKAMEGRQFDKDGKDLGDKNFHASGWNLTPKNEEAALDAIAEQRIDLEEQRVKSIAENDAKLGAEAYRQLLNRYPNDKRATTWRAATKKLSGE
ncbi:MAG: hypothetical protein AAB692_05925 [Patescibacteria group bacterium]